MATLPSGWLATDPFLSSDDIDSLIHSLSHLGDPTKTRGGIRNLLDVPSIASLARSRPIRSVAESILGPDCFAVRGILFDKTPDANWKVIWHQDLTIAVKAHRETPGFGPWSTKDGVIHVHAPASILENMLAVRLHLDDCGEDNGPVRVIPGSHRAGHLNSDEIDAWKAGEEPVACTVKRGGILAFHPLLLHASSPAKAPAHRRVIHLEFANVQLPGDLEWYKMVSGKDNLGNVHA